MKKTLIILSLLALTFSTTAYADFDASVWKLKKTINGITPAQSGSYLQAHLDREVSFHAKADLSDLRLLEDGIEMPYQLVTLSESVRSDHLLSSIRDLSSSGGKTMFIVDLSTSGVLNDHLRIISESKNFKKPVTVFAADSALALGDSKWRQLTDSGYIYNFHDNTSGFDAGSGEVNYPETSSRYLKVVIGDGEGEHISVSGAEVFRISRRASVENTIRTSVSISENPQKKTTEITLDLGGAGIPTHRIDLATHDESNFSRRALVLASNDGISWSSAGEGYLFSLHTPLFSGKALTLPYGEIRSRYVRVLVLNQDDQPIKWDSEVALESTVRAVVFFARAGKNYELYYGNTSATAPSYDLSRYFQYVESSALAKATLGGEETNPNYVPPAAPITPYSDSHPNILNAVLVLLVALLTFFLISYMKKIKHAPRGENNQ